MSRQLSNSHLSDAIIQPVALGGTGTTTERMVRSDLNILALDEIGVQGGAVPLDANGKVPNEFIPGLTVISGDTIDFLKNPIAYTGETVIGFITNYDRNREYILSFDQGMGYILTQDLYEQIVANGGAQGLTQNDLGTIIYRAPSVPGIVTININVRSYTLTVLQSYFNKPTIVAPLNTSEVGNYVSIFLSPLTGVGQLSLSQSQVQVAEDINFTTNVQSFNGVITSPDDHNSSQVDILNLTAGLYFVRARYDTTADFNIASAWSDPIQITVNEITYPTTLIQRIFETDSNFNENYFSLTMAMSKDGEILLIGDMVAENVGSGNSTGAIYIYKYNSSLTTYEYQTTLAPGFLLPNAQFGLNILISGDKQKILVKAMINTGMSREILYVFETASVGNYITWNLVTSYTVPDGDPATGLIRELDATDDFSKIVAVVQNQDNMGIQVFHFDGANISLAEGTGVGIDAIPNANTLYKICISDNGTRITVGSVGYSDTLNVDYKDAIYVLDFVANAWVITATIEANDNATYPETYFGCKHKLSDDGKLLVIGNEPATGDCSFYIYEDVDGAWTYRQKTTPASWTETLYGGELTDAAISSDNNTILLGNAFSAMPGPNYAGSWSNNGTACIYKRQFNTWVFHSEFFPPDDTAAYRFGQNVALSMNNDKMAISSFVYANGENPVVGSVFIYD